MDIAGMKSQGLRNMIPGRKRRRNGQATGLPTRNRDRSARINARNRRDGNFQRG